MIEIENTGSKDISVISRDSGIKVQVTGLDEMLDKVNKLQKILKSAKALSEEIANSRIEVVKTKL
ncbi:MAG: hypothetical protein J6M92_02315 [Oribacterium sp.]|nr:hypothetical protein [Oribacterium sp.]